MTAPSPYQSHNEVPGFGVIKNPLWLGCSLSIAFDGGLVAAWPLPRTSLPSPRLSRLPGCRGEMLRSIPVEVMQQDIPICAWAPAGTEPFSQCGLALFYLGSFRDEVGMGDSVQAGA